MAIKLMTSDLKERIIKDMKYGGSDHRLIAQLENSIILPKDVIATHIKEEVFRLQENGEIIVRHMISLQPTVIYDEKQKQRNKEIREKIEKKQGIKYEEINEYDKKRFLEVETTKRDREIKNKCIERLTQHLNGLHLLNQEENDRLKY